MNHNLERIREIVREWGSLIKGTSKQYGSEMSIDRKSTETIDYCIEAENLYSNFNHYILGVSAESAKNARNEVHAEWAKFDREHNDRFRAKVQALVSGIIESKENHMKAFDRFEGIEYLKLVDLLDEFGIDMRKFDKTIPKKLNPIHNHDDSKFFRQGIADYLFKKAS